MKKQFTLLLLIVILFVAGCGKDDKGPKYNINQKTLITNYDQQFQFEIEGNPEVSQWSSSDVSVGTINSSGLFTAKKIGTTTISAKIGSDIVKSEVTVQSYGDFFTEPYIGFGENKFIIKSKEKRTLLLEDATGLYYRGENIKVSQVFYMLEYGAMKGALVAFIYSTTIVEEVVHFYNERYSYLGSDDVYLFFNDGKGSIIGITVDETSGLIAAYIAENSVQAKTALMSINKESSLQLKIKDIQSRIRK